MNCSPVKNNFADLVRLLVVSREPSVLRRLWSVGESNSWHLETAGSGWEALERVQSGVVPNLLLLELARDDVESLHVLRWLHRLHPQMPIVLLSDPDQMAREKEAIRLGAQHFLIMPVEEKELESVIRKYLSPKDETLSNFTSAAIDHLSPEDTCFLGTTPVIRNLRAQAELLALTDAPVLIVGESGSGRETTARLIHKLSLRSDFDFLRVNCAALSVELLERELLGYREQMNTSHLRSNPAKFELSRRGTIFLENVAEMPISTQGKLVRVLQENQLARSGTESCIDHDVRVLASADINIERTLLEKRLREDLYYCLSAFTVHVPPLRQRRDEIPFLLQYFMTRFARHYALPQREFSPTVLDACKRYWWPGNVRELKSFVKRYLTIGYEQRSIAGTAPSDETVSPLFSRTPCTAVPTSSSVDEFDPLFESRSLRSLIHDVKCEAERNAIGAALEKTGWNRKAAARLLKVSYRTMLYKIDHYQMRGPKLSSPIPEKTNVRAWE